MNMIGIVMLLSYILGLLLLREELKNRMGLFWSISFLSLAFLLLGLGIGLDG